VQVRAVARTRAAGGPCSNERPRVQCDKLALHHGKRCVLWDDEGSGFCLWINWDWASNSPAVVDPADERRCARGFPHQRRRGEGG
jgi:hypothetical protein